MSPETVAVVCDYAEIRGRAREVFEHFANGLSPQETAERMEIAVATVHWHLYRIRAKVASAARRYDDLRDWWEFLLHEAIPGEKPAKPGTPLYHERGPHYGEKVSIHAGPPVTVDSMMEREGFKIQEYDEAGRPRKGARRRIGVDTDAKGTPK